MEQSEAWRATPREHARPGHLQVECAGNRLNRLEPDRDRNQSTAHAQIAAARAWARQRAHPSPVPSSRFSHLRRFLRPALRRCRRMPALCPQAPHGQPLGGWCGVRWRIWLTRVPLRRATGPADHCLPTGGLVATLLRPGSTLRVSRTCPAPQSQPRSPLRNLAPAWGKDPARAGLRSVGGPLGRSAGRPPACGPEFAATTTGRSNTAGDPTGARPTPPSSSGTASGGPPRLHIPLRSTTGFYPVQLRRSGDRYANRLQAGLLKASAAQQAWV
jgi:hypothetical protein